MAPALKGNFSQPSGLSSTPVYKQPQSLIFLSHGARVKQLSTWQAEFTFLGTLVEDKVDQLRYYTNN